MHTANTLAQQSGTVVGGRIPFETRGVERLVCEREGRSARCDYLKMNFGLFYSFTFSYLDKNKINSTHLHATLTAFQAGADMDRGWFWSGMLVN